MPKAKQSKPTKPLYDAHKTRSRAPMPSAFAGKCWGEKRGKARKMWKVCVCVLAGPRWEGGVWRREQSVNENMTPGRTFMMR